MKLIPNVMLLDTNVLIYHLNQALTTEVKLLMGKALEAKVVHISVITRIELLAWKGHTPTSLRQTTHLINQIPEFGLTDAVVQETIRIRKDFGLKLPDAVIAATAYTQNWQLLTANESDFKRVVGLSMRCV